MGNLVTYRTMIVDSERWERFEHRPGDVVISTPPKSGTTWTQMLCALLVFDGPAFPAKLDAMSPWLDMRIRSEDEVFAIYDGQTHRRFIKTHTPLDGLPLRDDVNYVVVGRDPRDVLVSWEHHLENVDGEVLFGHRTDAVGTADLHEYDPPAPPEPDPAVRFRNFVDAEWSPREMVTLANVLHHLDTGWEHRNDPNVGLFHFLDYRARPRQRDGPPRRAVLDRPRPRAPFRVGAGGRHRSDARSRRRGGAGHLQVGALEGSRRLLPVRHSRRMGRADDS